MMAFVPQNGGPEGCGQNSEIALEARIQETINYGILCVGKWMT